jgi:membrane associated rhomboid family serine protease
MGVYDREYYRDDHGGASWFSGIAPATRTIIVLNVAIWLVQVFAKNIPVETYLAFRSDDLFLRFQPWRALTCAFLHSPDNFLHILWNMMCLYFVGREIESMLGTREFTVFYLASAVFSSLGWAVVDHFVPDGRSGPVMGASGAVTALLVLLTCYFPNREVLLFFFPMRIWVLLAIFMAFDVLGLLAQFGGSSSEGTERTAFAGHLAGALFGALYRYSGVRLSRPLAWRAFRPRLRVVGERRETTPARAGSRPDHVRAARPSTSRPESPEQLEARLDEVLAKIAREGRGALTEEDRSILEEASRRARLRRSDKP